MVIRILCLFCCLFLFALSASGGEKEAEVIHWWVSGGEREALQVVIDAFESDGSRWVDTPVENSFNAKTAALSRMFDGYPPTLMQWHAGVALEELHDAGLLGDIDELARKEKWAELLPPAILAGVSSRGSIVAVPMTLHGGNWIWANKNVLEEVGVGMPDTLEDFFTIAEKIGESGFIPLALGGQPWQERVLFLVALLAVGGDEFYRAAIVEHQPEALGGKTMEEVFRQFGRFRELVDPESAGRNWSETTQLVIKGRAAFQCMGDWAKGEFQHAGQVAGEDFLCAIATGTQGNYLLVSDVFAMGKVKNQELRRTQLRLAKLMMDRDIQQKFNAIKGSIPPRKDVERSGFDICAQQAMQSVYGSSDALLPGFNMANGGLIASTIMDVLSGFWNNPAMLPREAARRLQQSVAEATVIVSDSL